jgi:hypothetical protein
MRRRDQACAVAGILERLTQLGRKAAAEADDRGHVVHERAHPERGVDRVAAEPIAQLTPVRHHDVLDEQVPDGQEPRHLVRAPFEMTHGLPGRAVRRDA